MENKEQEIQVAEPIEAALYLVPVPVADGPLDKVLPEGNARIVRGLRCFLVENVRSARRFLRKMDREFPIDQCRFTVIDEHTDPKDVPPMLAPLEAGEPMGVISEAGCPAVADPGADAVAVAQRRGLKVVPLVGPSSILLSLMASGLNGQSFAFLGYLPVEAEPRQAKLREMLKAMRRGQTQIFIETPYRNNRLLDDLCSQMPQEVRLCVASGLTGARESVRTQPISRWQREKPDLDKTPAIFLMNY